MVVINNVAAIQWNRITPTCPKMVRFCNGSHAMVDTRAHDIACDMCHVVCIGIPHGHMTRSCDHMVWLFETIWLMELLFAYFCQTHENFTKEPWHKNNTKYAWYARVRRYLEGSQPYHTRPVVSCDMAGSQLMWSAHSYQSFIWLLLFVA